VITITDNLKRCFHIVSLIVLGAAHGTLDQGFESTYNISNNEISKKNAINMAIKITIIVK